MYHSTRLLLSLSFLVALISNLSQAQGGGTLTSTGASSSVSLSPCVIGCLQSATGCTSYTDAACTCSNTQFQSTSRQCIQSNCPATDLQAALAYEVQMCSAASSSLPSLSSTVSSQNPNSSLFTIETSTNVHISTSAPGGASSASSMSIPSSASNVSPSSSGSATGPAPGSSTSHSTAGSVSLQSNNGWVPLMCGIVAGVVGGGLLVM